MAARHPAGNQRMESRLARGEASRNDVRLAAEVEQVLTALEQRAEASLAAEAAKKK